MNTLITDIVTDFLTTQMTESYNAVGVAPTLTQALFVLMQRLTAFTTIGTAINVKRIDGVTAAYGLTLDSATTPTGVSRTS